MDEQFKRSRLAKGDILLSIRGSVGRLVMVPEQLANANITQDNARLTIQNHVSSAFVFWYIQAESTQSRMRQATKGVAVRGINIGDVRALQVPLSSKDEQVEIVNRIEARYLKAKAKVGRLPPALLAKAFRGELVA